MPYKHDDYWMQQALLLADKAFVQDEVPIGAIVVRHNAIIGSAWNQNRQRCDPTAHAEILALQAAGMFMHSDRLIGAQLYVTLEPCLMCLGAVLHAGIERLVFGAYSEKTGAVLTVYAGLSLLDGTNMRWRGGVLKEACLEKLQQFFAHKRSSLLPSRLDIKHDDSEIIC